MKALHVIAFACFLLAMGFYVTPWPRSAMGLVAFGMVFEAAAWVAMFKAQRSTTTDSANIATQTTDQPIHRESSR